MAVVFTSNKAGAVLEMSSPHIPVSMRRRSRAITLRNRLFSAKRPSCAEWPLAATAESQRSRLVPTTARPGSSRDLAARHENFLSLWRYEWTPKPAGESQLIVRATDGEGKLQISEYRNQIPDGATGLHCVRANVVAS